VLEVARTVRLDVDRLRGDMQDEAIEVALDKNNKLAQALHITGTPGFVIGDEITSGAKYLDALLALIAKARSTNQATK
jgi:protein-disulfide isomerase